jgi:hypothetical protein
MRPALLHLVRLLPAAPLARRIGAIRRFQASGGAPRLRLVERGNGVNGRARCGMIAPLAVTAVAALAFSSAQADAPAIVGDISSTDPFLQLRAIEALVAVANSAENHDALVQAGAVSALVNAYRPGETASASNVSVLRALADLARKETTHEAFSDAQVSELLATVFRDCGLGENSGGIMSSLMEWLGSLFGGQFDASSGKQHQSSSNDTKSEASQQLSSNDRLGQGIQPISIIEMDAHLGSVNIVDGLVYHATRCAANLSRNSLCHTWLMAAGVLDPMINILTAAPLRNLSSASSLADLVGDEQKADTIRFATLAVAALSKTAASEVALRQGHRPLIELLGQTSDTIAQMYAAGGIRNLARHADDNPAGTWKVHREIVVDGVARALSRGLEAASPQTQVFSVLAVGDVLATGHQKADIICKRMRSTFEPFAALLKSGNAAVRRAVYRSLDVVYSGAGDQSGMHLSDAGKQKLQLLSKSLAVHVFMIVDVLGKTGDPAAMNALASLCLDDELVSVLEEKGVIPVAVGAMAASGDYGDNAVVALARLSNRQQFVPQIASTGCVKACTTRSKPTDDCRWEAALLANIARDERYRPEVGFAGLKSLMRATMSTKEETHREGARGFFNLTIGGVSRVLSAQGGALPHLIRVADSTSDVAARRYAIGAIAAISEVHEFGAKVVQLGSIKTMLRAAKADPTLSRDVARCFAQLSNHVESHLALATEGAVDWLVCTASRGDAAVDTLYHSASALLNISSSSGAPHDALRRAGGPAALTGLASGFYAPHVVQCARLALANFRGAVPPTRQHADPQGPVDPA